MTPDHFTPELLFPCDQCGGPMPWPGGVCDVCERENESYRPPSLRQPDPADLARRADALWDRQRERGEG